MWGTIRSSTGFLLFVCAVLLALTAIGLATLADWIQDGRSL